MQQLQKFIDLGLSESTIASIQAKGFLEPTAIQAAAIPLLLQDEIDVVGKAQTGTGKTAAFGLPILEIVDPSFNKVQALILLPTRELAVQVATEIDSLKGKKKLEVLSVYGGSSIDLQMRRLNKVVHVVVGTPGRVLDHLRRNTLDLSHLKFVVLDEADEMLNMGFIEDVETILAQAPSKRRTLLFSATMPQPILNLAKNYMGSYQLIEVNEKELTPSLTTQYYYEVKEGDKFELLCRLIDLEPNFYALIKSTESGKTVL
jgi:ATP-dependent RNA helicase DeaD